MREPALQSSKMAASMNYIPRRGEGNDGVILAKFSHGQLNAASKSTNPQLPEFKLYRCKDQGNPRKKSQRILVAETDSMNYVGQNFGIHAPKHTSHCRYLVGVLNKKSGKMKVYDSQSFHLRPWFGESQEEESANGVAKEELTYMEKSDRLTEAFGSSRRQRALESRLRSAVTSQSLETLANKALEHAQSQPQTATIADDEAGSSSIIPPYNKQATRLEDVYNLDDIISPSCMEMLKVLPLTAAFVEATKNEVIEWREQGKYCDYILDHLTNLPKESEDRTHRACILAYMHYLRKMHSLSMKDMKAKKVIIAYDLPDSLNQHLLDNFTQMSASVDVIQMKRCFPKKLKDKVLLRLLTLALLIDEFKTDLVKLQKGLTAKMRIFGNHAKALGCKVKSTSAKPPEGRVKSEDTVESASVEKPDAVIAELCLPSKFHRKFSKGKRM